MMERIDARQFLSSLSGQAIETYSGRRNIVLAVEGEHVLVGTERSPKGQPIPLEWIQSALDRLIDEGEVEISVPSLGYRSAFVGAVMLALPGVVKSVNPPRARLVGHPGLPLDRK